MSLPNYYCRICGWVYNPSTGDPKSGIDPGVPFKNLPDDFVCPVCGVGKEDFLPEE